MKRFIILIALVFAVSAISVPQERRQQRVQDNDNKEVKQPRNQKQVTLEQQKVDPEIQQLVQDLIEYRKAGNKDAVKRINDKIKSKIKINEKVEKRNNRKLPQPKQQMKNGNDNKRSPDWTQDDVSMYFDLNDQKNIDIAKHLFSDGNESRNIFGTFEQWDGTSNILDIGIVQSTNNGESFNTPIFLTPPGGGVGLQSPQVYQINEDYLGVIYGENFAPFDNDIIFSRIEITTGTVDTTILVSSMFNNNRPSLVSDVRDYPSLPYLYTTYHNFGNDSLMFNRGENMGDDWSMEMSIVETGEPNNPYSSIAYDNDMIFVAYTYEGASTDHIGFVRSTDLGVTWSSPIAIDDFTNEFSYPDIAVVADDFLVITYEEDTGSDQDILYAYSTDAGANWTTVNFLTTTPEEERTPVVAGHQTTMDFYISYKDLDNSTIEIANSNTSDLSSWDMMGNIKDGDNAVNDGNSFGIISKVNPITGFPGVAVGFPKFFATDGDFDPYFDASWLADWGDVNIDGTVDQADVDLILDLFTFQTNFDVQQSRNMDVSLSGFGSELDAAIIQKFLDGDIPSLPYDTTGGFPLGASGSVDMPDMNISPGETIQIPVNLSGTNNVLSFGMYFEYDGSALTFNQVNWNSSTNDFVKEVVNSGDSIFVSTASSTALNSNVELATLEFTVNSGISSNTSVTLYDLYINEEPGVSDAATANLTLTTDIEDENRIPDEYSLNQNYPNPFNPATTIEYGLPEESNVTVTIYNALGQKVTELFDGVQNAGIHQQQWNADNYGSGVYFLRLNAESLSSNRNIVSTKKMLLMK